MFRLTIPKPHSLKESFIRGARFMRFIPSADMLHICFEVYIDIIIVKNSFNAFIFKNTVISGVILHILRSEKSTRHFVIQKSTTNAFSVHLYTLAIRVFHRLANHRIRNIDSISSQIDVGFILISEPHRHLFECVIADRQSLDNLLHFSLRIYHLFVPPSLSVSIL